MDRRMTALIGFTLGFIAGGFTGVMLLAIVIYGRK